MHTIIFPGSFDPPTRGHLDIISRASPLFDRLYIAVGHNNQKPHSTFSQDERVHLLKEITHSFPNVEVLAFNGLLVDLASQLKTRLVLRSIRNLADFEYETLQAHMNRQLGDVETVYMVADERFRLVSSSLIREVARYGRRLHAFVPDEIEETIFARLSQHNFR